MPAFSCDLVLEQEHVEYEHHHLLPWNPFLMFDAESPFALDDNDIFWLFLVVRNGCSILMTKINGLHGFQWYCSHLATKNFMSLSSSSNEPLSVNKAQEPVHDFIADVSVLIESYHIK